MPVLQRILKQAVSELRDRESARDEVLGRARRARIFSKQAILLIHNGSFGEADEKIGEARRLLGEMKPFLLDQAELWGFDEVHAAMEEYSEASILHGLKTIDVFPDPDEIEVPLNSYLLGMADVVGELRREALEALRVGDIKAAEAELEVMEHIYLSLLSVEEASLLLKGLRRKLDIARGVIERTRGELTAEAGRQRLSDSLKELTEKLDEE